MPPTLVLASASPRRADLLRQLGLAFAVIPGHPEEIQPEHLSPHEIAQINAYRKARVIAKQHPDALVLGADTIVCLGRTLLGKPADFAEACAMLARLQGTHEVVTGVCLMHLRVHRQKVFAASTAVTFRQLHAGQIRRYLSRINITMPRGELAGRVLLVDDLADSGVTLKAVVERLRAIPSIAELRSAVIWLKAVSTYRPDYFVELLPTSPWIHQPFEEYDEMRPDRLARKFVI